MIYRILRDNFARLARVVWVARAVTESSAVPRVLRRGLARFHAIWVPASFHMSPFYAAGIPSSIVHVVPEAVDSETWGDINTQCHPALLRRRFPFLTSSRYIVESIVGVPSWNQARKAVALLLRAFSEEFMPHEDGCLSSRDPVTPTQKGSAFLAACHCTTKLEALNRFGTS